MPQVTDAQLLLNMIKRRDESGYNPYSNPGSSAEQMGGVTDWIKAVRHPINTYQDFKKYSDKTTPEYETAKALQMSPEIDWLKASQYFRD